ncbi:hypothetical protein [Desulforamulus aeronauticus]|uniref:hypothetical protein n=1 Tax=Desulforamulus aeronauticus TaxID=53343 RepID=UPI000A43F673|nr:hypothetical protein [Desulforamulus aeronauticus]
MKTDKLKSSNLRRKRPAKDHEPRLFSPFVTERMEDYAALSLATLIIIMVLVIHQ